MGQRVGFPLITFYSPEKKNPMFLSLLKLSATYTTLEEQIQCYPSIPTSFCPSLGLSHLLLFTSSESVSQWLLSRWPSFTMTRSGRLAGEKKHLATAFCMVRRHSDGL